MRGDTDESAIIFINRLSTIHLRGWGEGGMTYASFTPNNFQINLLPTVQSDWLQTVGSNGCRTQIFLQSDRTVGSKLFGVNEPLVETCVMHDHKGSSLVRHLLNVRDSICSQSRSRIPPGDVENFELHMLH